MFAIKTQCAGRCQNQFGRNRLNRRKPGCFPVCPLIPMMTPGGPRRNSRAHISHPTLNDVIFPPNQHSNKNIYKCILFLYTVWIPSSQRQADARSAHAGGMPLHRFSTVSGSHRSEDWQTCSVAPAPLSGRANCRGCNADTTKTRRLWPDFGPDLAFAIRSAGQSAESGLRILATAYQW